MTQPPTPPLDPVYLFITAFIVSGMAGVASLLRTTKALTWRLLISALLNSGALGLGIAFVAFSYLRDNNWFLLGLCLFAGLGGMTTIGFLMLWLREGVHLDIKVNGDNGEEPGDDPNA